LIEINECICGPDFSLELFAAYNIAGTLKQRAEKLERLNLQFDPQAVAAQFARNRRNESFLAMQWVSA
jgi:hypothetical protein